MTLSNSFIIVIPTYNAEESIENCLLSVLSQTYKDLGIIIRNDISTDKTDKVIRDFFGITSTESQVKFVHQFNGLDRDILYIVNDTKKYGGGNTYDSAVNYVDNSDSIIGVVDADDSLINLNAVKNIENIYTTGNYWMVWSNHRNSDGSAGTSKPLPPDEVIRQSRNYWSVTHFRTSKVGLFHHLDVRDLLDPFGGDTFMPFCCDAAFLFPFCEMCGNEKSFFDSNCYYLYNNNLPTNEHNKNVSAAIKYGTYIRQLPQYPKLTLDTI